MKSSIDPLATSERVTSSYQRYLTTFLPLGDAQLREGLAEAVSQRDAMTKGPFLEASPPYASGASIGDLVAADILSPEFLHLCSPALPADRPLYRHQEQAIRKAAEGRSLVVATGTGSGKTESFLVPILDSLCREKAAGTLDAGVRALLLYPMNALANDQVKRLREILADYPDITFGRYTGETKETPRDAEALFAELNPGARRLPNELLSRREMRENPPHILLTNYAMLEYLLLRPADMDLFEGDHGGHWQWLAIDEAHVYTGSLGSEIAMLMRRLRERVAGTHELQAILTSATVGSDNDIVAKFASNLSGSPVEWDPSRQERQDIVTAARRALPGHGAWQLRDSAEFELLADSPDAGAELLARAQAQGWQGTSPGDALAAEEHVVELRRELAAGPRTIDELTRLGSNLSASWSASALAACVQVASKVKDSTGTAVLNARYHLFAKAAEGAFTCLGAQGPHVLLSRHERCATCGDPAFEIGACSRCGHVYLCGRVEPTAGGDRLVPVPRSDLNATWFMLDPEAQTGSEVLDEDDVVLADDAGSPDTHQTVYLCVSCGLLHDSATACPDPTCGGATPRAVQQLAAATASKEKCGSCGRQATDLVRPFSTGNDAAAAVLATALYQEIPPAADQALGLPGEGRKLLLFSDSRQAASFFASYLESSFDTIRRRSLVLSAIPTAVAGEGGPAFVEDVIADVAKAGVEHRLFNRRDSRQARERAAGLWVMQEVLSIDDRQSLEGLGQISVRLDRDPAWRAPAPLFQLGLTEEEAWTFLETLVMTIRSQGALTMPRDVSADDEAFSPRRGPIYVRGQGSESNLKVLSWLPSRAGTTNRRLSYVQRVLRSLDADESMAPQLLEGCWKFLTNLPDAWLQSTHHAAAGAVKQVDHTWLRLDVVNPEARIYRCDQCHRLSSTSVRGVCPATSCHGTLTETVLPPLATDTNHYRNIYRTILPMGMSVREHTAQWISTKAAEIQQQFVKGEVNILSCSTTFELGVDVGELEGVMMRNVPPSTANYLQRAGRAGRRTSSAAVVLTFAQRRPHDLARFQDPVQMISGEVRAPYVHLDNDRIDRRHAHSVALAHFFRDRWTAVGVQWKNAGDFFLEGSPTGAEQLLTYLEHPPAEVVDTLRAVLPASVVGLIGVDDGSWADVLGQLVTDVRDELARDVAEFEELRKSAHLERNDSLAARYGKVSNNLKSQQLLGYLAQRNVLPKYGFPVDTVDMRTMFTEANVGSSIQLTRDLSTAIYEYAPGAQVVAGGHLWTSGGVYRMPGKDLEIRHYAVCTSCGHYQDQIAPLEPQCPACGEPRPRKPPYAKPVYGFVAARKVSKPGTRPPERAWNGSTHVRRMSEEAHDHVVPCDAGELTISAGPRGQLVAISEGKARRGFWICDWCGWGESFTGPVPKKHRSPMRDQECGGKLRNLALGHNYETDVMRVSGGSWADEVLESPSVLYALLEGASRELDIARDDIDGTMHMADDKRPALVLFDTVAGGAGNVLRIVQDFDRVARRALHLVRNCECGEETSCFACLRTFRNDRFHEQLTRREAALLLQHVVIP